jgi:hypothetical protein
MSIKDMEVAEAEAQAVLDSDKSKLTILAKTITDRKV